MAGGGDNVFDEPHMRPQGALPCWRCGYDRSGAPDRLCPECGAPGLGPPSPTDLAPDHPGRSSVFDEPGVSPVLAGPTPDTALTYARWLATMRAATPPGRSWPRVALLSLAAGPWAVLGACIGAGGQDGLHSLLNLSAIILIGPIMEEVMKAAAAAWAVETRPYWFTSPRAVIACCAAAGLSFSAIENLLYLYVYVPDPQPWLWWWRWTVCTALHTGCSTIAGLGLARVWRHTITAGTPPNLSAGTPWLITAIVLHGLYNAVAVALEWVNAW